MRSTEQFLKLTGLTIFFMGMMIYFLRTHIPAPLASAYAAEYFTESDRNQVDIFENLYKLLCKILFN